MLPDTYDIKKGATRASVVATMQAAMTKVLADEWAARSLIPSPRRRRRR
jgi:UPF0755 protein